MRKTTRPDNAPGTDTTIDTRELTRDLEDERPAAETEEDYGETEPFFATTRERRERRTRRARRVPPPYDEAPVPPAYDVAPPPLAYDYPPPAYGYPAPVRRRKSKVPYLIVSFFASMAALVCLGLPFLQWVSYHYELLGVEMADGKLALNELAKTFYDSKGVFSLFSGTDTETMEATIPADIQAQYAQARLAALALAVVFLISMVLLALFVLAALVRLRKTAAALGIVGSLLYGGATLGAMYGVKLLNGIVMQYDDYSWNLVQFRLLDAPYYALGAAAAVLVLCILFAILGIGTGRKYR